MVSSQYLTEAESFDRVGPIILIGHRGSGKSALGAIVAERLKRPFFDLDVELRRRLANSFADLLRDDPDHFREQERRTLSDLLDHDPSPIIACGAGIHPIPAEAFAVWIARDDWQDEVRRSDRPRVRPQLSLEEEWDWMQNSREPRWRNTAHLRLAIPQGRDLEHSALELETLLRWSAQSAESRISQKIFFVPMSEDDLPRAISDARRLGMAGIEIRSDIFSEALIKTNNFKHIASLRHREPAWLQYFPDAEMWDIDVEFIEEFLESAPPILPDQLVISIHPESVDEASISRLEEAAESVTQTFGVDRESLVLKYAPLVSSWEDLQDFLELTKRLRVSSYHSTILPRGERVAWMRPILAEKNATNYLPVGLRSRSPEHPSAMDFKDFLPHLAGAYPTIFDALIGDPVRASQGDIWHRRAALSELSNTGYLKIPVSRASTDKALTTLATLPIRGISITSPLKREAAKSALVDNPKRLKAVNTLRRCDESRWLAIDTDEAGMKASLEYFESQGVGPGRALVIGRGGASFAVLRALDIRDWEVVEHLSGREGWLAEHLDFEEIDLIVNAAGSAGEATSNTPPSRAWLDLHYNKVGQLRPAAFYLQGDLFFDAQARAQRLFWNAAPPFDII